MDFVTITTTVDFIEFIDLSLGVKVSSTITISIYCLLCDGGSNATREAPGLRS